jgi:formylglycine-generating enzyme required for sulfatase activity
MKIRLLFLLLILTGLVFASGKYALVIGNKDYAVSPLRNSLNDSQDMANTLKSLGFQVTLKNNVNDVKGMVSAVNDFTGKMSNQGLFVFYYSGHGIQLNGKNYLVPTGKTINDETDIEFDCMDIDRLLSKCEAYSNNTNIIILDACRDNPFASSSRSVSKGLAVVGKSPGGTLIAYSTSPGKTASDGTGRNGLYTQELLKAIKNEGLPVEEAFKEVRRNVKQISGGTQVPWETSSLETTVSFSGALVSAAPMTINTKPQKITPQYLESEIERDSGNMIFVQGGTFQMGSNENNDEKPIHSVTVGDFYIGKTEVTQAQYQAVMGKNPSNFKGENLPVEQVSWSDAVEYCKKLSQKEGVEYRLPTEAEWEFAARGGNKSRNYTYSGSDNLNDVAWYSLNSGGSTKAVGGKQPNELGIFDMTGNVWEWCSDWFYSDYYNNSPSNNPTGPSSGASRVLRSGSWNHYPAYCRITFRGNNNPNFIGYTYGFRVVSVP